ncbi:hypothetical protein EIP91_009307, partial [Steccherinum ochraceum]
MPDEPTYVLHESDILLSPPHSSLHSKTCSKFQLVRVRREGISRRIHDTWILPPAPCLTFDPTLNVPRRTSAQYPTGSLRQLEPNTYNSDRARIMRRRQVLS